MLPIEGNSKESHQIHQNYTLNSLQMDYQVHVEAAAMPFPEIIVPGGLLRKNTDLGILVPRY